MAAVTDLPQERVDELAHLPTVTTRLEQPAGHEAGGATVGELLVDATNVPAEDAAVMASRRRDLERALQLLPRFQRQVLTRRYGLGHQPAATLGKVARELRATRNDVRAAELDALRTLAGWADHYRDTYPDTHPNVVAAAASEPPAPRLPDPNAIAELRSAYQATHRAPNRKGKSLVRQGAATQTVRPRPIIK